MLLTPAAACRTLRTHPGPAAGALWPLAPLLPFLQGRGDARQAPAGGDAGALGPHPLLGSHAWTPGGAASDARALLAPSPVPLCLRGFGDLQSPALGQMCRAGAVPADPCRLLAWQLPRPAPPTALMPLCSFDASVPHLLVCRQRGAPCVLGVWRDGRVDPPACLSPARGDPLVAPSHASAAAITPSFPRPPPHPRLSASGPHFLCFPPSSALSLSTHPACGTQPSPAAGDSGCHAEPRLLIECWPPSWCQDPSPTPEA